MTGALRQILPYYLMPSCGPASKSGFSTFIILVDIVLACSINKFVLNHIFYHLIDIEQTFSQVALQLRTLHFRGSRLNIIKVPCVVCCVLDG